MNLKPLSQRLLMLKGSILTAMRLDVIFACRSALIIAVVKVIGIDHDIR